MKGKKLEKLEMGSLFGGRRWTKYTTSGDYCDRIHYQTTAPYNGQPEDNLRIGSYTGPC